MVGCAVLRTSAGMPSPLGQQPLLCRQLTKLIDLLGTARKLDQQHHASAPVLHVVHCLAGMSQLLSAEAGGLSFRPKTCLPCSLGMCALMPVLLCHLYQWRYSWSKVSSGRAYPLCTNMHHTHAAAPACGWHFAAIKSSAFIQRTLLHQAPWSCSQQLP